MSLIGQTAELQVLLTLQDQLSPGLATVNARIATLSGASGLGGLTTVASRVETAMGNIGNALSHAGSQISGLVKNIGLFGGAIALFSVGGAIKSAIDTANTMAKSIETLTELTGESAPVVSQLLAVFERFGVSTDTATTRLAFMEKTLGTLSLNQKALNTLQTEFGVTLTDSSGHIDDVNTALQVLADYMNSNASAADKAALASKLLGRGYVDLLPVLSQGAAGIAAVESQATSLGNTLDQSQVDQLLQYQTAMRDLGEAMQGLGLQIAVTLVPQLTILAQNITNFVETNRGQIITFFEDAGKFAESFGAVIEHDVVPGIKAIIDVWNGLPGPLKTFLETVVIGGKITHFLFDFGPLDVAKLGASLAASFIAKIVGSSVGSSVASSLTGGLLGAIKPVPVFVTNPGFGGVSGAAGAGADVVAGGEGAAVAGGGALAPALALALAPLLAIPLTALIHTTTAQELANVQTAATKGSAVIGEQGTLNFYAGAGLSGNDLQAAKDNMDGLIAAIPGVTAALGEHSGMSRAANEAEASLSTLGSAAKAAATWAGTWTSALQKSEQAVHNAIFGGTGTKLATAADTTTQYWLSLSSDYFKRNVNAIPDLSKTISELQKDETAAVKAGSKTTADKLATDISELKTLQDKLATANSTLATINSKTPVKVDVTVNSGVTIRDYGKSYAQITSYGVVVKA